MVARSFFAMWCQCSGSSALKHPLYGEWYSSLAPPAGALLCQPRDVHCSVSPEMSTAEDAVVAPTLLLRRSMSFFSLLSGWWRNRKAARLSVLFILCLAEDDGVGRVFTERLISSWILWQLLWQPLHWMLAVLLLLKSMQGAGVSPRVELDHNSQVLPWFTTPLWPLCSIYICHLHGVTFCLAFWWIFFLSNLLWQWCPSTQPSKLQISFWTNPSYPGFKLSS